ncbi:hypothetical protein FP803_02270, partial [Candidatus Woesearchaeota archaeon]|nr:hypothetical protein [Candidatus Woesearchaeota archaeon]
MKKSWKENKDKNKTGLCNSVLRGSSSNKSVKIFLPALILMFNLAVALFILTLITTATIVTIPMAYAAGTVSHPASHVTAGTFDTGNFTFPNYLFITNWLGIGTTSPRNTLNVIGTGNFTTDLYVAEQQVCREDGTNCPAGAGETGNVTDVTGSAPITSTGGATPQIAITMLGDLATSAPVTGSVANIFPGTDGNKATIALTMEGDLVTTSPIGGGVVDIFPGTGTKATITIQDGTTSQKGAVQLENSTSSTSITTAATPYSVKAAYDLAASKTSNVGNVTDVTGSAPITSTGGATPDIGITMLGDLATTSPITGAASDIFPGATGAKATIGITVAKDIVAGAGLTGGEDNVLPGADADTTLA